MSNLINESTIRNFVGVASFVGGLICFGFSSIYDNSFGTLGSGGRLVYAGISLSIFYLIWGFKRIRVPETKGFQIVMQTTLFVAICLLSVEIDILVPRKSDALAIISYGLFALMSVSKSRRSELGFETGFFFFFLSLFSEQLIKTNRKLVPIALVFCLGAILLRHRSISDDNDEYYDVEAPYTPEESLSSIIQEESSEAASEENRSDGGEQREDIIAPLPDESSNLAGQHHVSLIMPSSPPPQPRRRTTTTETAGQGLPIRTPSPEHPSRRRVRVRVRVRVTPAIQNFLSSLGDLLRRWRPPHLLFFFLIPDSIK